MRQFVVVGHDAPTTAEFPLDDLPGAAGRLDVLCRCVRAAFFRSHDLREDVRVHLVLGDRYTVSFDGPDLRRLNPDERSTAALVRTALERRDEAVGAIGVETTPGVRITRLDLASLLDDLEGALVTLHEDGTPVHELDADALADAVFVCSDHREFTDAERALLDDHADHRLRLGPHALHADDAVTLVHHYLDTDGYERW